jgi:hypothetical protein
MEEKEISKKGRWRVSGHPGKLLRDEIVTSPGRRESDPASILVDSKSVFRNAEHL